MKYSKQVGKISWLSFDRTRRYCWKGFREEHFFLNLTVTYFKFLDIYISYKKVILFILVLTTLFIILMVNWENLSFVCSALLKVLFVFHNSVSMQLFITFIIHVTKHWFRWFSLVASTSIWTYLRQMDSSNTVFLLY